MPKYFVEYKVATLLENAVIKEKTLDRFKFDDLMFIHWDFNIMDGWIDNAWIVSGKIEANNGIDAANKMKNKIQDIISCIAFIGQAYIEHYAQPFVVKCLEHEKSVALFYFLKETDPVPLMFENSEKKIMENLARNPIIPKEFFYYWKDAVNNFGYSSKLLLMFSAIESLAKSLASSNKSNKYVEIGNIVGEKLREDLWKKNNIGLRHRLVHGEYLQEKDKNNYVEKIHSKVVDFFNKNILDEDKISTDIINPQRNMFRGNGKYFFGFIEPLENKFSLDLKNILDDFEKNEINDLKKYSILYGERLEKLKEIF